MSETMTSPPLNNSEHEPDLRLVETPEAANSSGSFLLESLTPEMRWTETDILDTKNRLKGKHYDKETDLTFQYQDTAKKIIEIQLGRPLSTEENQYFNLRFSQANRFLNELPAVPSTTRSKIREDIGDGIDRLKRDENVYITFLDSTVDKTGGPNTPRHTPALLQRFVVMIALEENWKEFNLAQSNIKLPD